MWSLTPFEQYMVDDDCIGFPMDFTAIWSCEGSVNQAYLQRSLDEALKHHPLLTSRLEGKKWVPSGRPVVVQQVEWCQIDTEKMGATSGCVEPLKVQLINLSDGHYEIHMTFHHASCDGIGAMEFCGDVFKEYAKKCSGSNGHQNIPKRKQVGAATLLDSRGVLERPVVEGVS